MRFEIQKLRGICGEVYDYRRKFETFEDAWNACPRGDWLLDLIQRLNIDKERAAACQKAVEKIRVESKATGIRKLKEQADVIREMLTDEVLEQVKELEKITVYKY